MGAGDIVQKTARPARNVGGWERTDIGDLLSTAALTIGAGSATDAGRAQRLPTEGQDEIVLASGVPDAPTIPVSELRESLLAVLAEESHESMIYGGWLGFDGLREAVARRQTAIEGIPIGPENLILHNGSSGALDNICDAFIDRGEVVIVEGPSFSGTVRTIRGHGADVVEVGVDDNGVSVGSVRTALEEANSAGQRVKILYTIADCHNPTGTTMSLERRNALLEICAEYGVIVLEDAAYSELYFDGPPPPSLFALSGGRGVVRMGSFSKVIATGLRAGWVEAAPEYIEALAKVRFDMGNSPLVQRALARYVDSGALEPHVDRMRSLYAQKCDTLVRSLNEHCGPYLRFTVPTGGFFLWVECIGASAGDVAHAAAEEGLVFAIGANFFRDGVSSDDSHLRLAFSYPPMEELEEAGERMLRAFQKVVD